MPFRKSIVTRTVLGSSERFVPESYVVSVVQDVDTALLDIRSERYFTLNEVGTRVWELLGEGTEIAVIAELLAEEYDAPFDTIEVDLHVLISALVNAGLVRPV